MVQDENKFTKIFVKTVQKSSTLGIRNSRQNKLHKTILRDEMNSAGLKYIPMLDLMLL
jgi:hypothetical protein